MNIRTKHVIFEILHHIIIIIINLNYYISVGLFRYLYLELIDTFNKKRKKKKPLFFFLEKLNDIWYSVKSETILFQLATMPK